MASRWDEDHPFRWERVEEFACTCAFLSHHPAIEFVVPDEGSRLAKYISTSPTVLHHLAFAVENRYQIREPLMFPLWARGARNLTVNFAAPRDGILVEYVIPSRPLRRLACASCGIAPPDTPVAALTRVNVQGVPGVYLCRRCHPLVTLNL